MELAEGPEDVVAGVWGPGAEVGGLPLAAPPAPSCQPPDTPHSQAAVT